MRAFISLMVGWFPEHLVSARIFLTYSLQALGSGEPPRGMPRTWWICKGDSVKDPWGDWMCLWKHQNDFRAMWSIVLASYYKINSTGGGSPCFSLVPFLRSKHLHASVNLGIDNFVVKNCSRNVKNSLVHHKKVGKQELVWLNSKIHETRFFTLCASTSCIVFPSSFLLVPCLL
jgi:hypothetical protein